MELWQPTSPLVMTSSFKPAVQVQTHTASRPDKAQRFSAVGAARSKSDEEAYSTGGMDEVSKSSLMPDMSCLQAGSMATSSLQYTIFALQSPGLNDCHHHGWRAAAAAADACAVCGA